MKQIAERSARIGMLLIVSAGCVHGGTSLAAQVNPVQASLAATQVDSSQDSKPSPPAAVKAHDDNFVIGNDDVLAISVWKEQDLSRSIPVRSDGMISMPLVGEIQAAGRSPLQLEREIADKLKNFITTPEVTVIVQEIKSQNFNILGMVVKPGSYSLTGASTIMDAIATAGGFKDFAKKTKVYVIRQAPNGGQTRIDFNYKDFINGKNLEKNRNIKLAPHDSIVVP
jgi:polysaccharide export outer membrane protein